MKNKLELVVENSMLVFILLWVVSASLLLVGLIIAGIIGALT